MATHYVPNQYPDLVTALMASANGDTIVLDTSVTQYINGYTKTADTITIQAADGRTPVLDHTDTLASAGLTVIGNSWTFRGLTIRNRREGGGNYALLLDGGTGHAVEDCIFEGQRSCFAGTWSGTITRTQFRSCGWLDEDGILDGTIVDSANTVTLTACEFIRCRLDTIATGTAITFNGCTLIQSRARLSLMSGTTLRNCTAQLCEAGAYIFNATTDGSYLNAFECTGSSGNFNGAGTNRTTVDPQHVNLTTDLRLLPGSPLIRAGATPAPTTDYNGAAYQSPPSIGSHESIVIASADATDSTTLVVELTGDYVQADVESVASWTITTPFGVQCAVLSVEYDTNEDTATLTLWPGMSPGADYMVTAAWGCYGSAEAEYTVADDVVSEEPPAPYRYVAAIMNGIGAQIDQMVRPGETLLAFDFNPGDPIAYLTQSTVRFTPWGAFWCGQVRFTYTGKTDAALHGVSTTTQRITAIPAGQRVVLDESAYTPEA